jgi:hypothetical protein
MTFERDRIRIAGFVLVVAGGDGRPEAPAWVAPMKTFDAGASLGCERQDASFIGLPARAAR